MEGKDGQAIIPKTHLCPHHAVTPLYYNKSPQEVRKIFSDIGRGRGYAAKLKANPNYDPLHRDPDTNAKSFCQENHILYKYDIDGNKYGWNLIPAIKYPMENATWGIGNWEMNRRVINIEICGDYSKVLLDPKALMLIADAFRAHDKSIGGKLTTVFHYMFQSTNCPGRIREQKDTLIDMINNPDKWNNILWPVVPEPDNWQKKYNDEVIAHNNTKELLSRADQLAEDQQKTIVELNGKIVEGEVLLQQKTTENQAFKDQITGFQKELGKKDIIITELQGKVTELEAKIQQGVQAWADTLTFGELLVLAITKLFKSKLPQTPTK